MSILIHGVSMPKDGKVLLIDPWGNVRLYWSKDVVAVGTGLHLCKASELPPHGRLGDLDALYEVVKNRTRNWAGGWSDIECVITGNDIKNAHTIIPPEGGGTDNG